MNRYSNTKTITTTEGRQYLTTTKYPDIPRSELDYYAITSVGDRYDTLAQQFYQDYTLWWVIASANSLEQASLVIQPGVQIRIPGDIATILNNFNKANK